MKLLTLQQGCTPSTWQIWSDVREVLGRLGKGSQGCTKQGETSLKHLGRKATELDEEKYEYFVEALAIQANLAPKCPIVIC